MKTEYTQEQIKEIASELRRHYSVCKKDRYGKPYRPHKRFDTKECWNKTAIVVLKLQADPIEYIDAQFFFCKSAIMANTLHGFQAQKRYRQYKAYQAAKTEEDKLELEKNRQPRQNDLTGRIVDLWHDLDYLFGNHDLTNYETRSNVASMPLRFDPLCVLLLDSSPALLAVFREKALCELEKNPHLKVAAEELGYGINLEAIIEGE